MTLSTGVRDPKKALVIWMIDASDLVKIARKVMLFWLNNAFRKGSLLSIARTAFPADVLTYAWYHFAFWTTRVSTNHDENAQVRLVA